MRVLNTSSAPERFLAFFRLCLLIFVFSTGSALTSSAQVGMLEFAGRAIKDGSPLPGATVTVYRNGTIEQEKVKVGKNGKFKFFLVFGHDYKITFTYPGCVDMYLMVYASKLSKDRSDLFPLYQTDIPFIEPDNPGVRVAKFKNPFTKVIYDGKKAFMDDEAYLAAFQKDLLIDPSEQLKILAEKEAREKAEKEKLEAAEKAKRDAEEKARKEAEALAQERAREEALLREAELARLKAEAERSTVAENNTMETEAMKLLREKEEKERIAKKNKEIKTKYVNDLLKLVAENERKAKERAFAREKMDARSRTVIEQMRRESELKARSDNLREDQKLKKKKELQNQRYKLNEIKKLVEAAAFAERSVRISTQKTLPDIKGYQPKEQPNVAVSVDEGMIKVVRITTVAQGRHIDVYRKETYFWGTVSCYKNDKEIPEATYNVEIDYFSSYRNK